MISIGFAGTAKNTGKTTAALHILGLARSAGLHCGLTSIGYDGENKDNITGLPKPRYFLHPGTILATAESCLKGGSAACRVIERTGVQTVLGPVLVAEVTGPGLVVLAGPNRQSDLRVVFQRFSGLGIDLALVDGALNRIVPLSATDGLVLSTGAALDERIPTLAAHAGSLAALFQYPVWADGVHSGEKIIVRREDKPAVELAAGSLLSIETAAEIRGNLSGAVRVLVIPGACDPGLLEEVIASAPVYLHPVDLVFGSPLKLVASGDPRAWNRVARLAGQKGFRLAYLEKTGVRLLTVNPFYPCYFDRRESYTPASVNKFELLAAVRTEVRDFPVVDIRQPIEYDLLALLGWQAEKGNR